ncbi:MAG: PTS IIA-like nitrogen regulatory protein PtsN [Gammaproteobacteria bacterium]
MQLSDLLSADRVVCDLEVPSKKRALELVSDLLARNQTGVVAIDIYNSLLARERLGGTGVGHGVAIPHGRLQNTEQTLGAFMRLKEGIDFDAIDQQPVDLIFALIVPEAATQEHLQTLATLARVFNDEQVRQRLRAASTAEELYQQLLSAAADQ